MKNITKRMISLLLTVIILAGTCFQITSFAETVSGEDLITILPGDVDANGIVSASDARTILRIASKLIYVDDKTLERADFNADGQIAANDARYALRSSAKLDPYAVETTTAAETTTEEPTTEKILTANNREYTLDTSNMFSANNAKYAVLYDYDNDVILYGKNMHSKCYPASTTKLVTACVASIYLEPDDVLTVGNELDLMAANASKAGLYKGQKIKFKEILKCLLLPSGCDAAYTIAAAAGRVAAGNPNLSASYAVGCFEGLMNAYAKAWGMNDSNFVFPDGYPHSNHYTSAYDMTIIAVKALSNELISEITSMSTATAYFESGGSKTYTNTNELINPYSARYYPYCIGLKTGSYSTAGQCLVSAAQKNDTETGKTRTFIAVVYNCPSKYARYADLKSLYDTAFSYFL